MENLEIFIPLGKVDQKYKKKKRKKKERKKIDGRYETWEKNKWTIESSFLGHPLPIKRKCNRSQQCDCTKI